MEHKVAGWKRLLIRSVFIAVLLALPAGFVTACSEAAPIETPTPVPTATPNPVQVKLYDAVWEGTYTVFDVATKKDVTRNIVLEFVPTLLVGEGAEAKRDEGAALLEGTEGWIGLQFVRVDATTGGVSFNIPMFMTRFKGTLKGDQITGTLLEGTAGKGTFEVKANHDKKPQRRKTKGSA